MKYIIFEESSGMETVRVFDEVTDHNQVAAEVLNHRHSSKLISAGKLYYAEDGGLSCVNGSTTLKIKFDLDRSEQDTMLILQFFRFRG